jgi:epoxyqueuosine reductase
MDLHECLVRYANQEGFPLAGTVDIELAFSDHNFSFQHHIEYYDHWIKSGYFGAMEYLVRGRDRRADPKLLFPEAESFLCVAFPYTKKPAGASTADEGPRYARYLQGPDYHIDLSSKLEKVMHSVKAWWDPLHPSSPLKWKVCVDTSAVLERSWAALAGLGWIGKNTLLIHPKLGSYLFLAEVLLNQKTGRGPSPLPNYCGQCTRCLNACPTKALQKPQELNSNRCISYWTLEKRGDLALNEEDRKKLGNWIAGCDLCQEACPFNRKPVLEEMKAQSNEDEISPLRDFATSLKTWHELLLEDTEAYKKRVKNSALNRVKPGQFRRNLAINLCNWIKTLDRQTHLPLLQNLLQAIQFRFDTETDESAQAEWAKCLHECSLDQSPNLNP